MTVSATLLLDASTGPRLKVGDSGYSGTKTFRVNTSDEGDALAAFGLPQVGDRWSESLPMLRVASLDSQFLFGQNDSSGENGYCLVRVDYAEVHARGRIILPKIGDAWTEWLTNVQTVQVYAVEQPWIGAGVPIANGQGCPREAAEIVLEVHRILQPGQSIPLQTFINLPGRTNREAVTLPPLYGRPETSLTFDPLTLRYRIGVPRMNGDNVEVVHTLVAARDHVFRWQEEDAKGAPTGPVGSAMIYPPIDWPLL